MNGINDLSLPKPFSIDWAQWLLFAAFSIHLILVLLMLGTAILSVSFFIEAWTGRAEWRWGRKILKTFLAHKSLAVVFGVGPLLLIQANYTVPFFNATSIFAPYWLLVIVLMILAFVSFDILGHKIGEYRLRHLFLGVIALASLLVIPSIFVLILTTSENPDKWHAVVENGFRLDSRLTVHWIFRYLHILGAAIVFGSYFHYLFTFGNEGDRKQSLKEWMLFGILLQFAGGPILILSVSGGVGFFPGVFLFIGVSAAASIVWTIFYARNIPVPKRVVPLLLILLYSMLFTRQLLQNESFIPLMKEAAQNRLRYEQRIAQYREEALNHYKARLERVYDNGETIYSGSCSFCHGDAGDGKGPEAENLSIPPEDIASVRTTREYLHKVLVAGVPGSSMPYFSIFDRDKLERLIAYLGERFGVLNAPEPVPVRISDAALKQATKIYAAMCVPCHGADGRGTRFQQNLRPPPPDLAVYSLSPERTFAVITNGYPGTSMPPFRQLPGEVRWGLVRITHEKRTK